MRLVKIKDVGIDVKFWSGAIFREYEVGLNVDSKSDYYDYMLINIPSEKDYLLFINITQGNNKAGSTLCYVKIPDIDNGKYVTTKEIKNAIGVENIFWLKFD
jgi:hypothetical protein